MIEHSATPSCAYSTPVHCPLLPADAVRLAGRHGIDQDGALVFGCLGSHGHEGAHVMHEDMFRCVWLVDIVRAFDAAWHHASGGYKVAWEHEDMLDDELVEFAKTAQRKARNAYSAAYRELLALVERNVTTKEPRP